LVTKWDPVRRQYHHATLTPDGKIETEFATPKDWPDYTTGFPYDARRSPDGKRAVLTGADTRPRNQDGKDPPQYPVFLCSFPDGSGLTPIGGDMNPLFWSPDGGTLVVRKYDPDHDTSSDPVGPFLSIDLKTGRQTPLPIPDGHWLVGKSPDGKHLLTRGKDPAGKLKGKRLFLLDRGGRVVRPLTDESVIPGSAKFGPDGQWVLLSAEPRSAREVAGCSAMKLYRTGIETPKLELLVDVPDSATVGSFALSPDGKRVAFERCPRVSVNLNPQKPLDPEATTDEVEFAVVVVGLDGRDARTIQSVKTKKPFSTQLHVVDWR